MRARYRMEINRDTRRPPIGEKREEKAEQLKRLELYAFSKLDEGRVALLDRAKAHPYEDLSSFFAEAEELARANAPRIGEYGNYVGAFDLAKAREKLGLTQDCVDDDAVDTVAHVMDSFLIIENEHCPRGHYYWFQK